jgi:hypothetical protein
VLKEAEAGAKVSELCRRDLGRDLLHLAQQVRRAGDLRDAPAAAAGRRESTAEVDLGGPGARHSGAEGRAGKKRIRPAVKREMVAEVIAMHGLSQRRACGLIEITPRSIRRAPGPDPNQELRERLRALAEERRRWGCPMLYQLIRREGWRVKSQTRRAAVPGRRSVTAPAPPAQTPEPSTRGAVGASGSKSGVVPVVTKPNALAH